MGSQDFFLVFVVLVLVSVTLRHMSWIFGCEVNFMIIEVCVVFPCNSHICESVYKDEGRKFSSYSHVIHNPEISQKSHLFFVFVCFVSFIGWLFYSRNRMIKLPKNLDLQCNLLVLLVRKICKHEKQNTCF